MVEKLLKGSPRFYAWIAFLLVIIAAAAGLYCYEQYFDELHTGASRDVSWGIHIAHFTYFVGIAASAVVLLLPVYFHGFYPFRRVMILGEFMAFAAVTMAMLFIMIDVGVPQRVMNVAFHVAPTSMMFCDMLVLFGYTALNLLLGWVGIECERYGTEPAPWVKTLIYVAIIWAFSIHTVTAFLYAGLPGRHFWMTSILAARFLSSAFCSGPATLLLLLLLLQRLTGFDPGRQAVRTLSVIIVYAMCINVFFFCLELFTAFYSGMPGHAHPFHFLFTGSGAEGAWVHYLMIAAVCCDGICLVLLIPPRFRNNDKILPYGLGFLLCATTIDKGVAIMIGGFTPNVYETITVYTPTFSEIFQALGVYAIGALLLSLFWKIILDVKKEAGTFALQEPPA
jgi:molybdopterin-containing oxidoreductase family membrane subunit